MKKSEKIKVALICHLSNADIRSKLPLKIHLFGRILRKILGRRTDLNIPDFAIWNTNLIEEIRAYSERVELHVVAPYPHLYSKVYEYEDNGVYFHFFRNKGCRGLYVFISSIRPNSTDGFYRRNRLIVKGILRDICPDIVHIVGIENPHYALSGLDCPSHLPLMVQLQTLMIDPAFKKNYPISQNNYEYRTAIERKLIAKADYICTPVPHFINIIKRDVKCHAEFINTVLPLAEPVDLSDGDNKEFDFVYFSADINKAADLAIEGFVLASKTIPRITLDVIGGYSKDFRRQLESRLEENGIKDNVTFEGRLSTHEDVLRQIRKSRFALLPLKIDIVSGTIREALANGLPVVTTITPGTPALNKERDTVLISPIGDHKSLADNMVKLYNNPQLAESLRENGAKYMTEKFSNKTIVKRWVEAYEYVVDRSSSKSE